MRVSVVVPAHNEQRWIARCLASLERQTHPDYEVIVVDDGSRDATARIAARFDVRLLRIEHADVGAARNAGAAAATGELLAMLDADEIYAPDFLERLVAPLADEGVRATFPGGVSYENSRDGLAPGWLHVRGYPDGPPRFAASHRFGKAFRRRDFERVGGYPPIGYGEDEALGAKLGPAVVVSQARWRFTLPTGVGEVFRKAHWIGRSDLFARQRPELWRLTPLGSLPAAIGLLAGGVPRAAAVRLIYDAGLLLGFVENRLRAPCARAAEPKPPRMIAP